MFTGAAGENVGVSEAQNLRPLMLIKDQIEEKGGGVLILFRTDCLAD